MFWHIFAVRIVSSALFFVLKVGYEFLESMCICTALLFDFLGLLYFCSGLMIFAFSRFSLFRGLLTRFFHFFALYSRLVRSVLPVEGLRTRLSSPLAALGCCEDFFDYSHYLLRESSGFFPFSLTIPCQNDPFS